MAESKGRGAGRPAVGRPAVGTAGETADRIADHEAIARLADELLPSLIARLGASGLGELEVREGPWHVRLRRPLDGAAGSAKRAPERVRSQPGHSSHGHAGGSGAGSHPGGHDGGRSDHANPGGPGAGDPSGTPDRSVATSPAVGYFRPLRGVSVGSKVRAGDPVAEVEVLGVAQEVDAPVDGFVGASLAKDGEAVEYGQPLVRIELAATGSGRSAPSPTAEPTGSNSSPTRSAGS